MRRLVNTFISTPLNARLTRGLSLASFVNRTSGIRRLVRKSGIFRNVRFHARPRNVRYSKTERPPTSPPENLTRCVLPHSVPSGCSGSRQEQGSGFLSVATTETTAELRGAVSFFDGPGCGAPAGGGDCGGGDWVDDQADH